MVGGSTGLIVGLVVGGLIVSVVGMDPSPGAISAMVRESGGSARPTRKFLWNLPLLITQIQ